MAAIRLVVALLLMVHGLWVSRASGVALASNSELHALFMAYKTRIWRLRRSRIGIDWVRHYHLVPTCESVHQVGTLLIRAFTRPLNDCSMDGTAVNSLAALKISIVGGMDMGRCRSLDFLIEYAIFKALLCGVLDQDDFRILEDCFRRLRQGIRMTLGLDMLLHCLTNAKCQVELFIALSNYMDVTEVHNAFSRLATERPDVVTKIVKEYIIHKKSKKARVTARLFSCLNCEAKCMLVEACCIPEAHLEGTSLSGICALGRLLETSFENAEGQDLDMDSSSSPYGEETQKPKDQVVAPMMKNFDCSSVPGEVWLIILGHCSLPFQMHILPAVCKLWKNLQLPLLVQSSVVQKTFIGCLKDVLKTNQIFAFELCPLNRFVTSETLLRYAVACLRSSQLGIDTVIEWFLKNWKRIAEGISEGRFPLSPELYFDLYVRCCRAVDAPLEFVQLPDMSDDRYIALIRALIEQHKIIPIIPARILGENFRWLVQMLRDNADLLVQLLRDRPQYYEKLVVHLLLTKAHIPPAIDRALRKASELYRLLTEENGDDIEKCLDAFAADSICGLDQDIIAHGIIDLCLTTGLKCDSEELRSLGNRIWIHLGKSKQEGRVRVTLSSSIMRFLCEHCGDYSEEQFCIIERMLVGLGIFDTGSMMCALHDNVAGLLNDPQVAIQFIQ